MILTKKNVLNCKYATKYHSVFIKKGNQRSHVNSPMLDVTLTKCYSDSFANSAS